MLSLVLSVVLAADPPPLEDRLKAYKSVCDKQQKENLAELQKTKADVDADMAAVKRGRIRRNLPQPKVMDGKAIYYRTADDKAADLARVNLRLKRFNQKWEFVQSGRNFVLLETKTAKTGDVGWLLGPAKVLQIVNESEMMIEYEDQRLWLSGVPTKDYVDDQEINPLMLWEVVGTKSYTSANDVRRTVLHCRSIPWPAWEKVGGKRL